MRKIGLVMFCLLTKFAAANDIEIQRDNRIQRENYDSNRVYVINTVVGRATLVKLEEDESLTVSESSVLGMGFADAWTLAARGNNIIFKQSRANPDTNLIIVTNKRTYAFDLKTAKKDTPATYVLAFKYPDTEALKLAKKNEQDLLLAKVAAAAKTDKRVFNVDYVWRGDNEQLKPTAAWDDGRFTRLLYDHSGTLPVFFKVLPDGSEARINYNVDFDDGRIVILQEVAQTIRVRLNNEVIEVINKNYQLPKFNKNGAGQAGAVRVENGVEK